MVREARAVEMGRIEKHEVKEEFDEADYNRELDGDIIDGRWVDEDRGKCGRSGIVAKHFKGKKKEPEVKLNYAGTPVSHGLRCMLSFAAEDQRRKMVLTDAESAYYQSKSKKNEHGRCPVMRPPEDVCQRGKLWRLKKAMPGMQSADAVGAITRLRCTLERKEVSNDAHLTVRSLGRRIQGFGWKRTEPTWQRLQRMRKPRIDT